MRIFGFGKKKKPADEIKRILNILKENSEDIKSRLMLANLYLQSGDQQMAAKEYHAAAKELSVQASDLEIMAIYKKILSLDGINLTEKALRSAREAEQLIMEARKIYEAVLQVEQSDEAKEASESHKQDDSERGDDINQEGISSGYDSEPVPIETLLEPSQEQAVSQIEPSQRPEKHPPGEKTSSLGTSPSNTLGESDRDDGDQGPLEFPDQALNEKDTRDSVHEAEVSPPTDSSCPKRDSQTDVSGVQMDDDFEVMLSGHETMPSPDNVLTSQTPGGLTNGDPLAVPSIFHLDPIETILGPSEEGDRDLPYNLGIAYYEMDLIDKAIKEFARAHNRATRTVESLFMLAKCYSDKGLFQNAADFIGQALKLDNLTQKQIDMLERQLEEIKVKNNLKQKSVADT